MPVALRCYIGGVCYHDGDPNPAIPCQVCDWRSPEQWSPANVGVACESTCLVDGVCQADGTCGGGRERNCQTSDPCAQAVCDPDIGCTIENDTPACSIGGQCYPDGTANPVNPCEVCNATFLPQAWLRRPNNTPCGGDCIQGSVCLDGTCRSTEVPADGFCAIQGVCIPAGTVDPLSPCRYCDPELHYADWTPLPNNTPCETGCSTGATCQQGRCFAGTVAPGYCSFAGECYADGQTVPSNPCLMCDSDRNQFTFSRVAAGTACVVGDLCRTDGVCNAAGSCVTQSVSCPPKPGLCQNSFCDPSTGSCVIVPLHNVTDTFGCVSCASCQDGACLAPDRTGICGTEFDPCRECDLTTGQCVPKSLGADCGSTCDTRRTCDGAGECTSGITVPGAGCINIGACPALQCDPQTRTCVETGANNGKTCGEDMCRVCQGGECKHRACGRCERCDPDAGCVPCDRCCAGRCGVEACINSGFTVCCAPNHTCVTSQSGTKFCCERPCGSTCCPAGKYCCNTGSDGGQCCNNGETCGIFGCNS